MWLQLILLMPVLIRAVFTDIKTGRIENRLMLAAITGGLVVDYYIGGTGFVLQGLKMAVLMTGVLFVLFLIKGLGAGDIKLLSTVGVFMPEQVVRITVAAFIIAGFLSLARIIYRAIKREQVLIPGETIHFSVPILLSVCITACMAVRLS